MGQQHSEPHTQDTLRRSSVNHPNNPRKGSQHQQRTKRTKKSKKKNNDYELKLPNEQSLLLEGKIKFVGDVSSQEFREGSLPPKLASRASNLVHCKVVNDDDGSTITSLLKYAHLFSSLHSLDLSQNFF